ncbi:MAG: phosphoribosyltransferase family protein [Acidimicrobiia bacterium]
MDVAIDIAARGTVTDGFVAVDHFLNHRVEPDILGGVGERFGHEATANGATLILTAEASGIPIGVATASAAALPLVYAKKFSSRPKEPFESRVVPSTTRGEHTWLAVDRSLLTPADCILIVDDVLATGAAVNSLVAIAASCGAAVAAVCCVIEKTWMNGADESRRLDLRVVSLVSVASPNGHLQPTVV